ncbi:unnamed protein product [Brassica oleracea]
MTARCDVATKSADSVNAKSDLSEEEIEAKAKGRTGGCTIATMDSHRTHTNPSTLLVTSAAELLPSTTVTSLRELLPSVSAFLSAQVPVNLQSPRRAFASPLSHCLMGKAHLGERLGETRLASWRWSHRHSAPCALAQKAIAILNTG